MLNGVTELLTHGNRTAKNAEKTYKSSEFGTHAQYKANALADLYEEAGITPEEVLGVNQMIDVQANLA